MLQLGHLMLALGVLLLIWIAWTMALARWKRTRRQRRKGARYVLRTSSREDVQKPSGS